MTAPRRAAFPCRPIHSSAPDMRSMGRRMHWRPSLRRRRIVLHPWRSRSVCTRQAGRATSRFRPRAPRLDGVWVVLADSAPLTDAVVDRVRAAGATPIFAEAGTSYERLDRARFRMRPGDPDDVGALLRDIGSTHGPIAGAIMLLDAAEPNAARMNSPTRGYAALVNLAAGLEVHGGDDPVSVIAVSFGAQSVLDEPIVRPDAALLFGPVIALPTEVRNIRLRSVDFGMGDAGAGRFLHRGHAGRGSRQQHRRRLQRMAQGASLAETVSTRYAAASRCSGPAP